MSFETFRMSRPARAVRRRRRAQRPPRTFPINTHHIFPFCVSRTQRNQASCSRSSAPSLSSSRAELTCPNIAVQEPRLQQIRQVHRRSIVEPSRRAHQLLELDRKLTCLSTSERRKHDSELRVPSSAFLTALKWNNVRPIQRGSVRWRARLGLRAEEESRDRRSVV